jgi:general secretion pathway protein A
MYCKFFGFSQRPFDITPNHRFLYPTPGHRKALNSLLYGIHERRGLIVLTGDVGTGKTTLLHAALQRLDAKTKWAFIFNTDLRFLEVLAMILDELKLLKPKKLTKFGALRTLNHFAIRQTARGGNVVIVVDEAQNLSAETMENLRLLSNLESNKLKLIQLVIAGQPELDDKFREPTSKQFVQRICLRRLVTPLGEKDTYKYLQHRLAVADYKGPLPFTPRALKMIWQYSKGVPRTINVICDNALWIAFAMKKKKISGDILLEVANDLRLNHYTPGNDSQVIQYPQEMVQAV